MGSIASIFIPERLPAFRNAVHAVSFGIIILQSSLALVSGATPAPPRLSPLPGTYTSAISVKITDITSGSKIYYTTDGTTPTIQSKKYTGAIAIPATPATVTVKTIGVVGSAASTLASAVYTIAPQLPPPSFSPNAGLATFSGSETISITSPTAGASIYYTTDGKTQPTTSSTVYRGPITVSQTVSIIAVAGGMSGYSLSRPVRGNYTMRPATPWFSPAAGTYPYSLSVKIADATAGTSIYYTTNGSTPTAHSTLYTGPISIPASPATKTLSAIAFVNGFVSWSTSAVYKITPPLPAPTFSPASGSYTGAQKITISSPSKGGTIYYTTDGSTIPTSSSPVFSNSLSVSSNTSIIAVVGAMGGYMASPPARATFAIANPAPMPMISAAGSASSTITITDPLQTAKIYYTVNGGTPTTSSAVYTAPFTLSSSLSGTRTIQAIAVASGYDPSAVAKTSLAPAAAPAVLASAVISSTPSATISPDFLGLSHEWNDAQMMMGSAATGRNSTYTKLLSYLTAAINGPLVLRIGGGTTDQTGLVTDSTVEPFIELANELPVQYILGVNFGEDQLSLAQEQASTFSSMLSPARLAAIEIGNEPDDYGTNKLRSASYSFADFLSQFQQWRSGILGASSVKIAGPSFGSGNWDPAAGTAIASGSLQANIITQHEYLVCYDKNNPQPNDFLLQPTSAIVHLYSLAPFVASVHAAGLPLRVDEFNSICLGGQPGLSNSFSSALWAIDAMFEYVNAGVDGVNWQSSYLGGAYDLFQFHVWQKNGLNQYTLATVRPLFYGLLMFARAAGNNSKLLTADTNTTSNVKVWATLDENGDAHVVIINKEPTASGNVQFTLPGFTHGTATSLSASGGYLATTGVTFGGQTFDNSVDGSLQGTAVTESLTPSGDTWTVSVKPASAVLVDLKP